MSIDMNWHGHEHTVDTDEFVQQLDSAVGTGAVAVVLTDLDEFGRLNEEFGREAGDKVLEVWIRTLTGSLPADAVIGRLGGDEFAIALPNASAENALIQMEEIRRHLVVNPVDGWTIGATFGIASRPPHATETNELLQRANEALARGKREGGGRVAIWIEEKMVLKSNYYSRAALDRLSSLASRLERTEASLLREALDDVFKKLR